VSLERGLADLETGQSWTTRGSKKCCGRPEPASPELLAVRTGFNRVHEAAPLTGGGFVVGGLVSGSLTLGSDVLKGTSSGSDLVFGVGK
jgi:hypothetical protein